MDSAALVRKIVLRRQHSSVLKEDVRMNEISNEEVGTQAHKDRFLLAERLPTLRQVSCRTKFPSHSGSILPCSSVSICNPHQCARSHNNSTAFLGNALVSQSLSQLGESSNSKESSIKLGKCAWENMSCRTELSVSEDCENGEIPVLHFSKPVNDNNELRVVVDCMAQTINRLSVCISPDHPGAPLERRGVRDIVKDSADSLDKGPYPPNHVCTIPNTNDELKTVGLSESIEETLGRTVRLKERFSLLYRECTNDVGLDKLRQVYGIIDRNINAEKQETLLKQLLGADIYSRYMGKIWQLKLFEEHLLD
ncbi:hypothetical protein EG68_07819 [Paragonimus skrjabini miyazakii]|uniref:Uncharacterized protein n=1 Tax=Paragonimus skrjabini miyazakii TaxID=59628 RepID=A0A8S9YQS2_9TREM|nr:hypothetical protein EG68_07819 [Paragonimus skrjabini miyazakii]